MTDPTDRTVVILQPGYLPWLGFFDLMYKSAVFVIYDNVQFDKHGWRNRNRIKTAQGAQWLTVPVLTKGENRPSNREVRIDNKVSWAKKHLAGLKMNYFRAPHFDDYFACFDHVYEKHWTYLIDLDMALVSVLMELLGLDRRVVLASDLNIQGGQTERLVSICKHFGASTFLEGDAGKAYLEEQLFVEEGIKVKYHGYRHPIYNQLHGEFISHMSTVDLLFNYGPRSLSALVNQ